MPKIQAGAISVLAMTAAMGWAHSALAADAAAAATNVEEVVVTASRVQATGFTAPTPTTVLSAADVQKTAPNTIVDALASMPAFRAATTSSSPAVMANLRNIGATRTLVLLDGRRHVPTQGDGTLDLNLIPQSLVARTEVVTGGASASWGSDAVAGVVNLILDTHLQGIRGTIQAGQSKYGDAKNWSASLAAGTSFLDGRGRIIAGADYAKDDGVRDIATPTLSRPWAYEERGNISNPLFATNGQPGVIYTRGVRRADNSVGGLITQGPLAGTNFGVGGVSSPFGYGTVLGPNMIGGTSNFGEPVTPGGDLVYPYQRYSALVHAEYDVNKHLTAFAEGSYEHSLGDGFTNPLRFQGTVTPATGQPPTIATLNGACAGGQSGVFGAATGSIAINVNNPFIPAATKTAMQAAGLTCIGVGRILRELPELQFNDGSPFVWRGVVGGKGELWNDWTWDAYYQYGKNRSQQRRANNADMQKFRYGIDAVVNPANGQTVCRVTISPPTPPPTTATQAQIDTYNFLLNEAKGCVPVNIFGTGSVTPQMAAYFLGASSLVNEITQQVAAVNVRGKLGHTWAGDISTAAGAEWRRDEIVADADPVADRTLWQTGSRKDIPQSATSVAEAYAEAVVPLARDQAWAKSLDLNGAVRETQYKTTTKTFDVTTWKVGATWDINDQFRLRATRSRDIRAGNLIELYTAASTGLFTVRQPISGNTSAATLITTGNPKLLPERAETTTVGAVYSPNWFEGLRLSLDYYKISIADAIGTLGAQDTVNRCYAQNIQSSCDLLTWTDATKNTIQTITTTNLNLNRYDTSGFDVEVYYRTPLDRLFSGMPGNLSARLLATQIEKLASTPAVGNVVLDPSGQFNNPHNEAFGSLNYDNDRLTLGVEVRWFQGGTVDNTLVCGALTAQGINLCHVDSTTYTFLSGSYKLDSDGRLQVFGRVNNLFNQAPPFPSVGGAGGAPFDAIGRAYRVGLRFKY